MKWCIASLVIVAACGRVNFDPVGGDSDGDGGTGDGATGGDGGLLDGSVIDTFPAACADAIMININQTTTMSTCATGLDRLDGCGPLGTQELVFKAVLPATTTYTYRAFDAGTLNINNSTMRLTTQCAVQVGCNGTTTTTLAAGTYYFMVEASSGGCASIDFLVSQP